jgi:hypothetical protein
MKGSAIRCHPRQHKFVAPEDALDPECARDRQCKHCGLHLQCFKGKHKYNGITAKLATCSLCGKLVKRRRRHGVINPRPR